MNQEIMLDEVQEVPQEGRPVFLTVLCILTWVWSGLFDVIGGAVGYLFKGVFSQDYEQKKEIRDKMMEKSFERSSNGNEAAEKITREMVGNIMESTDQMVEHGQTLSLIALIGGVICIVGALLMFNLKKAGFFIYTIGILGYVIAPLVVLQGNIIAGVSGLIYGVIGIVFIILYGVNLKHMKN